MRQRWHLGLMVYFLAMVLASCSKEQESAAPTKQIASAKIDAAPVTPKNATNGSPGTGTIAGKVVFSGMTQTVEVKTGETANVTMELSGKK